ncbi:MAG: ATP synthase F1 subunit gamma [Bacteroidetes bacterium RIFOXYA12_FULL_35_11]|nr:MAG: ATP synthase F1 subunit gamma [Bacteroidetes bacterium GWF2_35_48]OFY82221.1 MAG: ATP synthase F1 subunit gamma [Bacteroidetes bacterium RIFOXYA12_FULL_35_11]OFY93247.1 MAG: ATP synthase F1 subunit gamma [Bacteroidetes bacterium RIFOXYC12_FULL_35_7]OFY94159.1 MAG: ATP synthase F1 subunit gamma [Bacteroidetes bacterium RIFOXYB2_FULL_35_7]HBX49703.1 ATP synthase F1 subunit gamma [Bacteroidales bacterium]
MGNLKETRVRIASVTSTRQITSAMKMVSAAKLRKAQDTIVQIRPYATKLVEILVNLSSSMDTSEDNPYAKQRPADNVLIILITSNRGLCGAFNSNAIKRAVSIAQNEYATQLKNGKLGFIAIGKVGHNFLKSRKYNIVSSHNDLFDKLSFKNTSSVAEIIMQAFVKGNYDRIEIVYNQFKNAGTQILTNEQYLPVKIETDAKRKVADYIFEPSKEYIVKDLIPKSLKIQFYKAIIDSNAAEHGARMTAMHKATDNATDMIHQLKLMYNKERQASITKEILEIVGGAEALKG